MCSKFSSDQFYKKKEKKISQQLGKSSLKRIFGNTLTLYPMSFPLMFSRVGVIGSQVTFSAVALWANADTSVGWTCGMSSAEKISTASLMGPGPWLFQAYKRESDITMAMQKCLINSEINHCDRWMTAVQSKEIQGKNNSLIQTTNKVRGCFTSAIYAIFILKIISKYLPVG